ncbi:hypothetical protein [Mesorhizobium argentiipisi]|uniref:Uncharacterized protein n=1 Tax=Mesorhizobium argentiipisi TaxID=3015175 RepID=A0ABU8K8N8_9HYPH
MRPLELAQHGWNRSLAAELTNQLIPDAVLTPGMVGTIPQLQQGGFHYASSG